MLRLVLALSLFFSLASALPSQTLTGSFYYDGILRDYRLYLPDDYDGSEAWPLVFNLHGYTSNAFQQELYTQMNVIADTGRFLVCYPNGVNNAWNVGLGLGGPDIDDAGFLNALLDTLFVHYAVDPSRVYSCGMSNGGYMSYKLACESADRFAAIASVTGSMVPAEAALCFPSRHMPVLEIHGTGDLVVPYEGLINSLSIPELLQFWTGQNGCQGDPEVIPIPNTSITDGCTAELFQYNDCLDGTEVWHYKVTLGGHTWPGSFLIVGVTNQDFNASSAIWEFFLRHTLNGPSAVGEQEEEAFQPALYPNPFTEGFSVAIPEGRAFDISVWNYLGMRVWNAENQVDGADISGAGWPAGAYWVSMLSSEGRRYTRMVVKR